MTRVLCVTCSTNAFNFATEQNEKEMQKKSAKRVRFAFKLQDKLIWEQQKSRKGLKSKDTCLILPEWSDTGKKRQMFPPHSHTHAT